MAKTHPHSDGFLELIRFTQAAYEQRRLEDYLGAFAPDYTGVQLNTGFSEDYAGLRRRMSADRERYELLSMDFAIVDNWYTGDTGYAHMRYHTRLRLRDGGRVMVDRRENIVAGRLGEDGVWRLNLKVTLNAENYIEDGPPAG